MKEVIELSPRSYPQHEIKYTCSRCGQSCGDSEEKTSSYDVRRADIELKTGQKIRLTIGEPGAAIHLTELRKVSIENQDGSSFPEGAHITAQVVDCCTECFEQHALPALLAAGFQVREEDRSW